MTMKSTLLLVVMLAVGCGGKNKNDTEGGGTVDPNATTGDPTDRSGNMVPAEKMDEVNNMLGRKQMIMSRCLSAAVEAGEAPKGAHGKITLELSISPAGQATRVEVIKSTIEAKSVGGFVK